jgi:hypothetical protein
MKCEMGVRVRVCERVAEGGQDILQRGTGEDGDVAGCPRLDVGIMPTTGVVAAGRGAGVMFGRLMAASNAFAGTCAAGGVGAGLVLHVVVNTGLTMSATRLRFRSRTSGRVKLAL